MNRRREDPAVQTDRPSVAEADGGAGSEPAGALPSVREVLGVEALRAGLPEVLVGGAALEAPVRWVHVSDRADAARLLAGGELLLSTGAGWPTGADGMRAVVAELVAAGASGLVLELGPMLASVPSAVVHAASEGGLALIALHREVRFVDITHAVHERIISVQTIALRARDLVRERFTALALRGAPADVVVDELSQTLGAPVVLENLAREVVTARVPAELEKNLFAEWESRSRRAERSPAAEPHWLRVAVQARGVRWGTVVALPGPEHPAGRTAVLEQGAIALALGRLADGGRDEWARIGRQSLMDALLAGRYAQTDTMAARVAAAGFPLGGASLYGLVLGGVPVQAEEVDRAAAALGGRALAGSVPPGVPAATAAVVLSLPNDHFDDDGARRLIDAFGPASWVAVGSLAHDLDGALSSVHEAIDLARVRSRRERVRRAESLPLLRLVAALRGDQRLIEHGERMLAPLIDYDLRRGGDLLDVLEAMLAHPGNRTAAAASSHLSRSVFYQRLALIGELLGMDLDDGQTQTALHIAVLSRRAAGR